jgi:3'-phosphoadenosine 5'-phosphosulfate sulfotransferase (PAPS reductase)/FAD synthetase
MQEIIEAALARHEKVALQLSGGRDSIACLYLLRPYWDQLTVYWWNSGAAFPETVALMEKVRAMVPHFAEITSDQPGIVERFGLPSDIVPATRTPLGILAEGERKVMIQDRYSCCANVIMLPLHQRMVEDGVTLVIRGQKAADKLKATIRSGAVDLGIEYLFPIEDWSASQVMDYLRSQDAPIPRFYEVLDGAPDCMTCSAYWENGAAKYLKRYHHPAYLDVQARLNTISDAMSESIANFNNEVSA